MSVKIQIEINNCTECSKVVVERTEGAGYAFDYTCTVNNKLVAGYVEYDSEMPKEVPSWCPLSVE